MNRSTFTFLLLPFFAALLLAMRAQTAMADDDQRIRELQRSGQILSLEKIFNRARATKSGKVLDADLDRDKGRYIYEIELLDAQGRVWEMEFDARTGELLKLEEDD